MDSCAGTQGCLLALTYSASVSGRLMTALSEKHIMSFIKPPVQHWSERPTLDSSTQASPSLLPSYPEATQHTHPHLYVQVLHELETSHYCSPCR